GGVVDALRGVRGFVANSVPLEDKRLNKNPEAAPNYRNLKAQCAYMLAEEVNNHNVAVKPVTIDADEDIDYEELLTEDLEQIRAKDVDADDKKLNVAPKDEAKEALGRSPDYGDCMIMRMVFFLKPPVTISPVRVFKPRSSITSTVRGSAFVHRPGMRVLNNG
ncbi:MAG TPA: hypothetical protein VJ043_03235, partial [Candidatus Paceibacterota bacterium]|nr:hypothetical protein [Candidatus Paceibacterota bacterium]